MMKYFFYVLALTFAINAKAQSGLQTTPKGDIYQIFTHNSGDKIKLNDVITFQFIQKTDKDSVLFSTYTAGHPVQAQVVASQNAGDLMEVFPLLALTDSALVKVPTDSIFKGHEDQRPAFFPKGSYLVFVLKIEKIQSLNDAIAEKNAAQAEKNAEAEKLKATETTNAAQYITSHKLILKTTPSGLKYAVTKASLKPKPLKGDTLLVNYTGRTLDDKVFDTSVEAVAKSAGVLQEGRPYEPFQFIAGMGQVIPGWDEGLLLLNEGSKATLVIPSALGYGAQGAGNDIKPYSSLVFDVELVKVKPIKHAPKPPVKKPLHKKPLHKKPVVKKKPVQQ